jgi:hypothetical protein
MKKQRIVVLVASTCTAAATFAAGAHAGYGPTPTPEAQTSGGFTHVVATATRGPAGGSIAANTNGTNVVVSVPGGVLHVPLQITLVAANDRRLALKLPNLVGSIAVKASNESGEPIRGRLSEKLISVTLVNPQFAANDRVVTWDAKVKKFVAVRAERVTKTQGKITILFNRAAEFAVVAP